METLPTGVAPLRLHAEFEMVTSGVYATRLPLSVTTHIVDPSFAAVLSTKVELSALNSAKEPFSAPPSRDAVLPTNVLLLTVDVFAVDPTTAMPPPSRAWLLKKVLRLTWIEPVELPEPMSEMAPP